MQPAAIPVKTTSGVLELRRRSRELNLNQRHRTVLLLVDGKRPLGEVLHMALQAGASTHHFEELLQLGLVELPQPELPDAEESRAGALDSLRVTSVDLEVHPAPLPPSAAADETTRQAPPPQPPDAPAPEPQRQPESSPRRAPSPATAASPHVTNEGVWLDPEAIVEVQPIALALPQAAAAPPVVHTEWITLPPAAQGGDAEAPPAPVLEPQTISGALSPPAPQTAAPVPDSLFSIADHARPAPRLSNEKRVNRVRQLLIYTLGADAILFSALTLTRVRAAQTQKDLISLVWEIERQRSHARRSREQLLSLQRARELLGMGNTMVTGDSEPAWPDTEGQV